MIEPPEGYVNTIRIGVFSDTMTGYSPEEVAARTRELGVEVVQLRLNWPGLDLLARASDRDRVRRAYDQAGIEIAALAAYNNVLHPDEERRAAARAAVIRAVDVAADLGTRVVVTEAGTFDPNDAWSDHPHNHTPAAWAEFVDVTGQLVSRCEGAGVTLAYEPYVNTVLDSATRAHRLVGEIGSPSLGFVLDLAGLVTPSTLPANARLAVEAVELLRGRIALAHADDVCYDEGRPRWLPLGWGDLDAGALLASLVASGYDGALIIEHLDASLAPQALTFCRERLASVRKEVAEPAQRGDKRIEVSGSSTADIHIQVDGSPQHIR